MLNTVYRLVRPRQFEVTFDELTLNERQILIRPTHLSVCNADQRYYQGLRPAEILAQKLPMALIHESIGRVISDPTGQFQTGTRVVMVPNLPVEKSPVAAENYLRSSRFRGSSADGFMQEYILSDPDRVLALPDELNNDLVAVFTEMVTVCYHAIGRFGRFSHEKRDVIGVWGDGNMGYFTSLLLKHIYPESKVYVFGKTDGKLEDFSFADRTYKISQIPEDLVIDHAFEAVGGAHAGDAISQIIDHIAPEGTVMLLGVTENPVPMNTRMILEKGLRLVGTSRSGRADFSGLLKLYEQQPQIVSYLEKMVSGVVDVHGVKDMTTAFEMDMHKITGKTVMIWNV